MLNIDRQKVEAPYPVHWWGQDWTCSPKFVEEALGDGNVLLGLQPLNTRPNYYVIRVDSSWHLDGCRTCEDECPDELREHLDEIYDAIEAEYREKESVRYNNEHELPEGETPDSTEWPVLDLECGDRWFTIDPARFLSGEVEGVSV